MRVQKGDEAPAFELSDADGKSWSLAGLRGSKVVLFFYPVDSTPGCTVEACDFRDSHDDFVSAGYQVLGISPQGPSSKRKFIDKYSLNFPLLIDDGLHVAEAYGAVKERLGPTGKKKSVLRSTFLIAEDGIIEAALYGVSARGHVASLLELVGSRL